MPGVPPDAMAQVKKGLKGLFSRKKPKAPDSQGTATTSTAPSKTTTAAAPTPAAALGATSAAPRTEDLPPPPTPAQAPHAADDVVPETIPPPSHQKATFNPLPTEPPDLKFAKTTADPLKAPTSHHPPAAQSTTSRAAAVDPDTGKTVMGPLDRVANAPATTTTAAEAAAGGAGEVAEPPPGAIATGVPGQHPAMSATSGPLDAGEFAEGTH